MPRRRGLCPRLFAAVVRSKAILPFAVERQVVGQTKMTSLPRRWVAIAVGVALTLGAVALGIANLQARGWGLRTRVLYLPFDYQTFVDVTSSSIEEAAHCGILLPEEDGQEVRKIVAGAGPGAFDDQGVRLKMIGPFGDTVFVNQQGGVRARRDGTLTEEAMKRVTAILDRNCPRLLFP